MHHLLQPLLFLNAVRRNKEEFIFIYMDYIPKLQRQISCPSYHHCSNYGMIGRLSRNGEYEDEYDPSDRGPTRSVTARLRELWRKIVKEKRKILKSVSGSACEAYDPDSYAQNFDEGSASAEPENLSRSFSARFAVTSTVLLRLT